MFVVPLEKDNVTTKDGDTFKVVAYTNYKDGGPAVYARAKGASANTLIYFFDIDSINNVRVEYQRGSKVFRALGKIVRTYHLPQPDDKITVISKKIDSDDSKHVVEVASVRLKAKNLGVSRGMFVKDTEGNNFRLNQILDIDRALGGSDFDRNNFLSYYKDYTGASS